MGRRRGIHQHRQCACDVAGPALEIPGRRQEDRRPRRALARWHPVFTRGHPARLDRRAARRASEASMAGLPTRAAVRRSICKASSSAPTREAGCRWKNTWPRRSASGMALASGTKSIARRRTRDSGLNAKYLGMLWSTLNDAEPFADPGRRARLDGAGAHRQMAAARGRDRAVAKIALAVHQRRAYRQGWRPEGLDGAGQPDRVATGVPAQDARRRARRRRHAFPSLRATRATAMNTTTWSGNGLGWSRRDVRTCCSATCADVAASSATLRERAFERHGQMSGRRGRGQRRPRARSTWPSWRGGTASSRRSWRPGSTTSESAPAAPPSRSTRRLTAKIDECVGI